MKTIQFIMVILIATTVGSSCKKKTVSEAMPLTAYSVKLTDAPGPYEAVNVDIQGIEIKGSGVSDVVMLGVNAGIYNLLDFANGKDTLIAKSTINMQKVSQIRLILGSRNSVKVGGVTYALQTPSAEESGLKLQVHQDLNPGVAYQTLLDFDAYASIVDQGNGSYQLKPVIRTIENAVSGAIMGRVSPSLMCKVAAQQAGGQTYYTQVSSTADFLLKGIPPGSYSMTFTPQSPYPVKTLTNVVVTNGNTTNVGVVNF